MKKRSNPPQYTYRQTLKKEDQRIYRRIALIITAVFVIILIIWFMGTNFLNALSILSQGNPSDNSDTSQTNTLPLQAPVFDKQVPTITNQDNVNITGTTSGNVALVLVINDKQVDKTQSDSTGNFEFANEKLSEGLNLIKVTAKDKSGKTEEASTTITLDKTKPSLVINSPVDGTSYPANTQNVAVSGTTEPSAIVYINGSQSVVDANGKFSYNLTVQAGANSIEVKATDQAGNIQTVDLAVTVSSGG